MGKDIDENNENFQSVIDTLPKTNTLEERITRNIVEVGKYLVGRGNVKANSLKDIVPFIPSR